MISERRCMKESHLILAVVGMLATGCESPTSPSARPRATVAPVVPKTILPMEAQFQDSFWRQLVFDGYENPGGVRHMDTWALPTPSPNLYIRMDDPTGRRVVSIQHRDHMRRTFPRLVASLTGQPYRGRIEDGFGDRSQAGWITVQFSTEQEEPNAKDACGRARVGANPGLIWIYRRHRSGSKYCANHFPTFRTVFAHEVGHALGLWHVRDRNAVMHPTANAEWFHWNETYHANLLYRVGRGKSYCGWPFGASC